MRIAATLWNLGPVSTGLQVGAVGAVGLSIGLWIRAKTVDQSERGNAERRALFVGLWPPFLWMAGDTVRAFERGITGMRGRRARKW